jgi:hypothetical protein
MSIQIDLLVLQLHVESGIFIINFFQLLPLVRNCVEAASTRNGALATLRHALIPVAESVQFCRGETSWYSLNRPAGMLFDAHQLFEKRFVLVINFSLTF